MAIASLRTELAHLFNLFLAFEHKRKGKVKRARYRLDKALNLVNSPDPYLLAFDAVQMISEDRHAEARKRFRESLSLLPEKMDAEERYVSTYSRLWLAMYEASCPYDELERLWADLSRSQAGGTVRALLRVPPKEALRAEFGGRCARNLDAHR